MTDEEIASFPVDVDVQDYRCYLRYKGYEHCPLALRWYRQSLQRGKFAQLLDRKRSKQNTQARGRFHAKSAAGWYLNAHFVRGSGAYRVKHPTG